jgi:hypothetical protein
MGMNHSEETHQQLIARIPTVTGREVPEWFKALEDGPWQARFEDRVNWLRDEHGLAHGHATAIVHEHDKVRSHRSFT